MSEPNWYQRRPWLRGYSFHWFPYARCWLRRKTGLHLAARALLDAEFSSDPEVWSKALEALRAALEAEEGWESGTLWENRADTPFRCQIEIPPWTAVRAYWRPLPKGPEGEEEG